jgi:hypothetical protein
MADEPKYSYSIEELDDVLRKMEKGIMPLIPEDMMKESNLEKRNCIYWQMTTKMMRMLRNIFPK